MTAAALNSGLSPPDVAGAVPSRSALDLVQALVHDAETMSRQGYHGLLVTLNVDSAYPSGSPFMYMDDHAQPSWSKHPIQLAHHASLRVNQLCAKGRGLGLRIDPNKTEVLYIPPRGARAKRSRIDPARTSTQVEGVSLSPSKSIKWLGVSLDPKLSLATHAADRASATASVVGLVKRLSNTSLRGFPPPPPSAGPNIFNAVVTPSLLLARPPYRGWSRLHQAASGLEARLQWEPKRLGVRAWLALPPPPGKLPRDAECLPPDMHGWWRANKPASALWYGHKAKPFLEKFSRQCLSRWLAEASGHGDFTGYHCLEITSFTCPLATFANPLAGRLDPRAFWFSFQLFVSRASQIELWARLGMPPRGALIPTLDDPPLPLRTRPQSHGGIDPDTDSSDSGSELEIHMPGFVQV
ncbi:uncharacterized protein CTHT_0046630 [Thermochaetoides thermophila DSM 1495]|uniref:Reverse transcriptase domain-containing protein n=1 Tax=Chaetomium thermophilum (strain DSM 1495 / CBS 144.50 / IMI 039719) TaxID=759272 RepID=G0S9P5_CHATD|nr:hypothetical protein CTHT_0046630 [Thermochaetoides thermophila DSM 1495]EGS20156.1 hypothetical protein CTHT_0046630 [Thermochaetoides thermophila DSM 1495]